MNKHVYIVALGVACLFALAACGGGGSTAGSSSQPSGSAPPPATTPAPPPGTTPAPPPGTTPVPPPTTTPAPPPSTYVPPPVGTGGTIAIDQAWLTQQGSSPYYLTQPNMTYVLQTDVTTPGTAFVVLAPKIAFDLNGHTITYDDEPPLTVANGGFEQGSSPSDIQGWNVTGAPGAMRVPAITGMWGGWVLELPNIAATETITSSPITIPEANIQYAALITPRAGNYPSVTLSVMDTVTGATLASRASGDPDRGSTPVVMFTPTSTDPVQLVVTIVPPAGQISTVYLDNAAVSRTGSYGVIGTPAYWYLPPQLQTPTIKASNVADFALENGSIVQGSGHSYAAAAVFGESAGGITLDHINATASGDDTNIFELTWAINPVVINCKLTGQLSRISDRMRLFSAIQLSNVNGPVVIENNTITGTLHTGIMLARPGTVTDPVTITGNIITQNTLATNGYGILLDNVQNFILADNTVDPVNGRGLLLDTFSPGDVTENGQVHDNVFKAKEHPDLEYHNTDMEALGMLLRVYSSAVVKDVTFKHNTFSSQTDADGDWAAAGARIYISLGNTLMADSGLVFEDNTFQAVLNSLDPGISNAAWGLTLSAVPTGTGLEFFGNTFASNDISLNLGDNYGYAGSVSDILFTGNTITQLNQGAALTYQSVVAGGWQTAISDVRLIGASYTGGALSTPTFLDAPVPSDIETGWQLNLTALNPDGLSASGVSVSVLNAASEQVYTDTTDANGKLTGIPVATTEYQKAAGNGTPVTTTDLGPFTVVVTEGGKQQTFSIGDLTSNTSKTIQLK